MKVIHASLVTRGLDPRVHLFAWIAGPSPAMTTFSAPGRIGPACIRGGSRLATAGMATIVFDLDGTLVDTAPDLVDTLNVILGREGLAPVPYDVARTLIGHGARHMIARGLALAGRPDGDLDRMFADFLAYYADHVADRSRPFPGVEAALDILAARGCVFAVCTNKLEWLSVRLLTSLGLAGRFAAICGQDTFGVQKPHPDHLLGTLRRAGGSRDRAVMVGDSNTDIATAKAALVPVVAVDFGYTEVPVTELGPDKIISSYSALPAAIAMLLEPGRGRDPQPHPAPGARHATAPIEGH
jgi:phosphoglycolate phosphatase